MPGRTMPEPTRACQRGTDSSVDSWSFHDQMQQQREAACERPERGDEHPGGGAVLGDADAGVVLRVQLVCEPLDRRVEELGREHRGGGQQHQRPPQCRRPEDRERRERRGEGEELRPEAPLGAHAVGESLQRKAEPRKEGAILVAAHPFAQAAYTYSSRMPTNTASPT